MSSKYPYLDIAISVVTDADRPVNYSFNSAPTIALPSLSKLAAHFVNLSDGYVMWQVGGRRAFTYFMLNDEGTSTILAITVRMDPDILLAGRPIVNLLGTIRRTLVDGTRLTHETLIRTLSDSGFPEEPLRSDARVDEPTAASGLCCRSYISTTDLANIMAFPRQKEYLPYQGVIIIPATVSMQPESSIPVITEPLDKALAIVCPENVTASADMVELSDHLTVTYTLSGFDPQTVEFEVGTTNRYVRINGPALIVNTPLHAGISFTRSVPYSVTSANGNKLDTYTVLINGRTATRTEGAFEISNTDFHDGKVTIAVSSTNFGTYSREFTPEELSESTPLEIVLEPEARKIGLRLDFGGGRIIEDFITLEKNTPEYNSLRAGSFHGFRAHRLMGNNPETYNIDLRTAPDKTASTTRFVAPVKENTAEEPAAPETTEQMPETDIIEKETTQTPTPNVPSAEWEERPHKRVAPKFENISEKKTKTENGQAENESSDDKKSANTQKIDMRLIIIGISVIAIALVVWWLMLLFSGKEAAEAPLTEQTPEAIEEVAPTPSTPAENTAASTPAQTDTLAQAAEKADIAYLNEHSVWSIDKLRSEKYKSLITALREGDIQAIASHPYFSTPGTATNKRAVKMLEFLWAVKGTSMEKRNTNKTKELTKDGTVNIGELIDDLSRYQPAETNKAPRPGAQ